MKKPPGYKKRRPRPQLDQLAWSHFCEDAGVRRKKGDDSTKGYVAPGKATELAHVIQGGLYGGLHAGLGYWWTTKDQKVEKSHWRFCVSCGCDLADGETSVHPLNLDPETDLPNPKDPDWYQAHHVRCVTPEQWRAWMGHPTSAGRNPRPPRPRATEDVVRQGVEEGWLHLNDGLTPAEAAERIRESR